MEIKWIRQGLHELEFKFETLAIFCSLFVHSRAFFDRVGHDEWGALRRELLGRECKPEGYIVKLKVVSAKR